MSRFKFLQHGPPGRFCGKGGSWPCNAQHDFVDATKIVQDLPIANIPKKFNIKFLYSKFLYVTACGSVYQTGCEFAELSQMLSCIIREGDNAVLDINNSHKMFVTVKPGRSGIFDRFKFPQNLEE